MTDIPDNNGVVVGDLPFVLPAAAQTDYNELLYAHLLDADGNRLTYTHFTAKVNWNSMIEITFNRSVYIKANKVCISKLVAWGQRFCSGGHEIESRLGRLSSVFGLLLVS